MTEQADLGCPCCRRWQPYISASWPDTVGVLPMIAACRCQAGAVAAEGHGEPCYYCGEPCNSLAGDPGKWPVALPHRDDPGVVKWHHTRCVTERLEQAPGADGLVVEELRAWLTSRAVWDKVSQGTGYYEGFAALADLALSETQPTPSRARRGEPRRAGSGLRSFHGMEEFTSCHVSSI